jgi:hypothetical protein
MEARLPKLPAVMEALLDVLLAVRLRRALVPVPAKGARQAGQEGSAVVRPEEEGQGETNCGRR